MAKQKRHRGYLRTTFTLNGKRHYVYGKTQKELLENEIKKREEIEKGIKDLYNPTLNDYYEHFTEIRRREIKESTIRAQRIQYNVIANAEITKGVLFGNMRIKDITRRNIEDIRQKLLDTGKTPQYLNNCFAHLNHVFNSATIDETIIKNPCKALKQLKRDKPPIKENKHRALTEQETKLFFKEAEKRHSYYINDFLLMVNSGIRVGEMAALHYSDIDKKKGFIYIRHTITRNEEGSYIIGDSAKTKSGIRDIPLTNQLYDIIKEQEKLNRMLFGLEVDGILFRSYEGEILREYTLNREIKRICKAAGIGLFTCHAFRNTFATRFIEQRPQDYKILSEIMGHKDIGITLNLYTHVMIENKIKAMQDIEIKTS